MSEYYEDNRTPVGRSSKIGAAVIFALLFGLVLYKHISNKNQCEQQCLPFCKNLETEAVAYVVEKKMCYCSCEGEEGDYIIKNGPNENSFFALKKIQ